ncbi:MAG: nucleoside-diphosphate kinase [Candidatus Paceibacterota bacterium]
MNKKVSHEQTLIIIKPDAMHRNLLGEIIHRFERKGLKITGLKMIKLDDPILEKHYYHHKDKPFFAGVKKFMKSSPVVLMVLEGYSAISATRLIVGPLKGYEADAGSIRGDFSLSTQSNIVHASDSVETAAEEIKRFFKKEELFTYTKAEYPYIYAEDELPTE